MMSGIDIKGIAVVWLGSLLLFSCTREAPDHQEQPEMTAAPILLVQSGVEEDGRPTAAWIEVIRTRHDEPALARLQAERKTLTPEEQDWSELIHRRASSWTAWTDSLAIPFKMIEPPGTVTIVLGNAGGADAFTYSDSTIGFDLSRLHQLYGSATTPESEDRIDRFFAHEMTHVLHKAWQRKHRLPIESPLEYALWDCLVEGIGNYRSLSSKWVDKEGGLTSHAEAVLAELQPIFVERLLALEHASEEDAVPLLKGLSSGPFSKKWGALTSALWLAQEAKGEEVRLQPWIEAGPWGILDLAAKNLPGELKDKLAGLTKP